MNKENITLLGKWMPSLQASSPTTKRLARKMINHLGWTERQYRKALSALRKEINVVERSMCSGNWDGINFSHVPSRAAMIYKKAFNAHAPAAYSKFLTNVEKGEVKINASTLYPYDIVRDAKHRDGTDLRTLDAQWKALPDYLADNPHNGLVVADVSGSMDSGSYYGGTGEKSNVAPIDIAVSLAIYFAERNVGAFKNHFMIFGSESKLLSLSGGNIKDKAQAVMGSRPCPSTNLQSVFDTILKKGVEYKVPQSEMPSVIYIVSDMQFDEACSGNNKTNLEIIRAKYKKAGYQMPKIVFWCVNAYGDSPAKANDENVVLVSGSSAATFKTALTGKVVTPYEVMLQTVMVERYQPIAA